VRRQSEKSDPAADRLLRSLGLAARAGLVRIGLDAVCQAVESGRAKAIVIAGDAPGSVHKRLSGKLSVRLQPGQVVLDGDVLGHAIGRSRVVALAITDQSLGRRVIELAEAVRG
jgi:ribosomal protein L7Ae-like RNA K-turn-binding protein